MRVARRVVPLGAILCLLVTTRGVTARADGPTWSGTWARAEVSGNLVLTQTGNVVSGYYTWNDGSGHVSGTVSGSSLSGSFNENHYRGSFDLTLSGLHFSGSYSGVNKDTGTDISGPFNGTCTGGACLANAPSSPLSSASASASASAAAAGAEKALQDVLGGADAKELFSALTDRVANLRVAEDAGIAWQSAFVNNYPSATEDEANLIGDAAQIAATNGKDGKPVSPAVRALLPIIVRMVANGVSTGDLATEADAVTAARRLLVLALGTDLGYQQLGPALS